MDKIIIALDAMGGDNAPSVTVRGALDSLANEKLSLTLVGRQDDIERELSRHTYDKSRITIKNATEVIGNDEHPTAAIKQKKDSSIVVGLNMVNKGEASAFISAGNTGALLTGATVLIGRIKAVERPALAVLLPNENSFTFLIDCGANVDAKPSYLLQFAQMGSVYMENVVGIKKPRVGLVNIGAEKEKGNAAVKEAYELLANCPGINFTGNVEARDIPLGAVDVAVCDAFVGNVILKYTEGFTQAIFNRIKTEMMASTMSKLGALLSKSAFSNLKKSFDYSDIGGAPFLGLRGLVVKAHGNSDARAIKGAINQCVLFAEKDIVGKIQSVMTLEK